jgi:hypothetical protein
MKIYATKNQFTIVENDKMYVIPLVENICMTHDELETKIHSAIFQVEPNVQVISLNDNCQLYNAGIKAVNFNDNLTGFTPFTLASSNIQTMGEGFVIEDVLYYNNSNSFVQSSCTNQQLINYIYTLSKIFCCPNSLLSQYFIKNSIANIDTEWIELTTRYPSSLGTNYSLEKFITMFYSKNITYTKIQSVVLNTDILNIFRVITPKPDLDTTKIDVTLPDMSDSDSDSDSDSYTSYCKRNNDKKNDKKNDRKNDRKNDKKKKKGKKHKYESRTYDKEPIIQIFQILQSFCK